MLKRLPGIPLFIFILLSVTIANRAQAQCPLAYPNAAQLNWDNLDFYHNSGSNTAPYGFSSPSNGNYVTNTMEQTQRFAIGTATATFVLSNVDFINPGAVSVENASHTGNLANYAGEDLQFNPATAGRSVTITFNTPVWAPNFTLYDIDRSAVITVTATNNLGVATIVNAVPQGSTILTIGIVPLIRTITATSATLANTSNQGSATVTVPGAVNSITITATTLGSDPVFWLSDINACVATAFPTNWHQGANNRPFWGPTQTMPDYFLGTPDDDGAYMIDPATATARLLFTDPAKDYINSFGYDPYNRFLYYITENPSIDYSNKQVKRYNYNTETSSVIIADITAAPFNIPTMNAGVESAACAFYNGSLYFGIEGGVFGSGGSTITREAIVYRIDFNVSNVPISATQVYAINSGTDGSSTVTHDWGDIIIKNGIIYNCNTARNSGSDYSQSKFHHYNMMTGTTTNVYNNPGSTNWNGQLGMSWAQNLYYFRGSTAGNSVIGTYNEAGTCGAPQTITKVGGGAAWPGGAGDASDPFRPKCDFGDAPASYDPYVTPATQSPAVHERADTMWLGTTTVQATSWSREFFKLGTSGTDDVDNGLGTVPFLQPGTSSYLAQVSLYNNSSGNATVIAWLDFNGNGTFDAAEAGQLIPAGPIVPSGAVVTRFLYWPSVTTPLLAGSSTYLRIRITATAAGMTSSHATGYFTKGEVEDYQVPVDNFPLASRLLNFDAGIQGNKVKLSWGAVEETGIYAYEIERSKDNIDWVKVGNTDAHGVTGTFDYQSIDANPLKGVSYYRLKIIESTGMNRYSAVKAITFNEFNFNLTIAPNPAKDKTTLLIDANESHEATIRVMTMQGELALSRVQRLNNGSNTIELPLTGSFTTGMYIVTITAGNKIIHRKLIINK